MIIRSSKHILRRLLKASNAYDHPHIISHFFNCLLGTTIEANPIATTADLPTGVSADRSWASLTPTTLRSQIVAETESRYRYTLPASILTIALHSKLLREICLRVGIQIHLRSYNFGSVITPVVEGEASKDAKTEEVKKTADSVQKQRKAKAIAGGKSNKKVDDSNDAKVTFYAEDVLNIMPVVKSNAFKVRGIYSSNFIFHN